MKNDKPTTIASGRVEDLLVAIAKPKVDHAAQGQLAPDFMPNVPDEMQGQQHVGKSSSPRQTVMFLAKP
jgi:hypothetical protein